MKIQKSIPILLMIILIILSFSCKNEEADLVLLSAKVVTVDENFSIQEAVVIKDNQLIYVGTNKKAEKYVADNTKVIELDGKLVLPGLIDAHAHTVSLGNELANLNIVGLQPKSDKVF